MVNPNDRYQEALSFSRKLIDKYEYAKEIDRKLHYGSQAAVVILSGVTPLLLLLNVQPAIAAIPPAIASIAAGLSNSFRYREKYVSNKITFEELRFEHKKFELGLSPYVVQTDGNTPDTVETFINNIEFLHRKRMEEWKEIQQETIESMVNWEISPKKD